MSPPTDSATSDSLMPPAAELSTHGVPPETRALVDGIGVYTASSSSPFLTAPNGATAPNGVTHSPLASESPPDEAATAVGGQLAALAEPLRREIWTFPLRPKVSEEEVSGLVAAVLDLIARHLPLASDSPRQKH